jgi:hypothetical protein
MSRTGRNSFLVILTVILIATFSLSVLAAEEGSDPEGGSGEVTSTTISSGLSPAVSIAPDEAAPAQADWTYRYMIPTALALAVLIIIITAIKYFTDVVRKRYRIVEE